MAATAKDKVAETRAKQPRAGPYIPPKRDDGDPVVVFDDDALLFGELLPGVVDQQRRAVRGQVSALRRVLFRRERG